MFRRSFGTLFDLYALTDRLSFNAFNISLIRASLVCVIVRTAITSLTGKGLIVNNSSNARRVILIGWILLIVNPGVQRVYKDKDFSDSLIQFRRNFLVQVND